MKLKLPKGKVEQPNLKGAFAIKKPKMGPRIITDGGYMKKK